MFKVSVALCTFNGEKYIKEQLDSLKEQTRTPDEVIIIDDVSSDSTPIIINDYIEKNNLNWTFLQNEKNLGFKENFIKALKTVTGDICFLCDQDDVWMREKISSVIDVFSDSFVLGLATGFSFIDGNGQAFYDNNMPKGIYGFLPPKKVKNPIVKIKLNEIMHRNIAVGCACAYRKSVVETFLEIYDKTLPHDYQLNTVSAALSGLYYYNAPLTRYRIHERNTLGLKPLNQTRVDIAEEKAKLSYIIGKTNGKTERLEFFCKKRYNALKSKSFVDILKLFGKKEYYEFLSFKERVGDILYVLGK